MVVSIATNQNKNSNSEWVGLNAMPSALPNSRRLANCLKMMISASIGAGVNVRPAVNSEGTTANDPKDIEQKNKYSKTCGRPIMPQMANVQKRTIGRASMKYYTLRVK